MNADKQLATLLAIEAIKQLKYAYLRHLDLKEWDEVAGLFTPDVVSTYSDGKHSYHGRCCIYWCTIHYTGHYACFLTKCRW